MIDQGLCSHGAARSFPQDELVDLLGPCKRSDSWFPITSVLKLTGETTQVSYVRSGRWRVLGKAGASHADPASSVLLAKSLSGSEPHL